MARYTSLTAHEIEAILAIFSINHISSFKVLPLAAIHSSIERAKKQCQKGYTCDHVHLEEALLDVMESHWEQTKGANLIN